MPLTQKWGLEILPEKEKHFPLSAHIERRSLWAENIHPTPSPHFAL